MPDPGWRLGGRYTLLERLGAGVAGEVWRAQDESAGTGCAVKLLRPELVEDEGALARLRATIAWISQLTHPNIVPVDDLVVHDGSESPGGPESPDSTGLLDGTVALISRLVPGESLRALLDRQGTMPTGQALSLTAQLCDALAAARHVGVAHGDVKPSNLLLEPNPDAQIALRLTDFGMAALLGRAAVRQTVAPQTSGENTGGEYVAPELGAGEAPAESADVYAAAVVLYEALTGEPPFGRRTRGHARRDGSAPLALPADLPDAVAGALVAGLDENPRHRPSAAELAAVLREAPGVQETVPPPPAVEVAPGPNLDFFGDDGQVSQQDQPPAPIEKPETAAARRTSAVVAAHGTRRTSRRALSTQPWTIVAASLCGVALAAFITFGLATHGSPHANGSTLPSRAALIGPAGSATSQSTATTAPTSTSSATASPTPSTSASATTSPSQAAPSASADASTPAAPAPSASGSGQQVSHTGRLFNTGSSTCLDTSGGYFANGVVEQIWTCDNGIGQVFTLASTGQLTVDGGQYCLADATSADATGTHPELFTCGSQSHERWTMRSDGSLVGDHSGLCVNAPGNDNGTQLDFEPCSGQTHQLWSWE